MQYICEMILLSNAKINLGLNITNKRPDGFHEIESIFLPIPFYDEILIEESDELTFTSEGIEIPGIVDSNLCLKAYRLIKEEKNIPFVRIHLKKRIPIGAGLGGGSSNAAFVLKGLNDLFNLKYSILELELLAAKLGSDCPFFIQNRAAFVSGRGDVLNFKLKFSIESKLLLVYPNIHIGSKEAYSGIIPKPSAFNLELINSLSPKEWQTKVVNDFEYSIMSNYKELRELKNDLLNLSVSYVSMTGSGSSFFALYEDEINTNFIEEKYFVKKMSLII
jgi:4-diphosphocytidyl-2-C-methyl-D-erythritol kinase